MGDGSINGDIESKKGNIVLIKGNINGSVKADKVITAEKQSTHKSSCETCKYASSNHFFGNSTCYCHHLLKYAPIDSTCSAYQNKKDNKIKVKKEDAKEDTSISNYLSVHPIHLTCPKCHNSINKNLRINISAVGNKVFHTMVTPLDNDY